MIYSQQQINNSYPNLQDERDLNPIRWLSPKGKAFIPNETSNDISEWASFKQQKHIVNKSFAQLLTNNKQGKSRTSYLLGFINKAKGRQPFNNYFRPSKQIQKAKTPTKIFLKLPLPDYFHQSFMSVSLTHRQSSLPLITKLLKSKRSLQKQKQIIRQDFRQSKDLQANITQIKIRKSPFRSKIVSHSPKQSKHTNRSNQKERESNKYIGLNECMTFFK